MYRGALEQLRERTQTPLPNPEGWFVVDEPSCDAAVHGNTLMLSKGALELESDHTAAIVAHELGHLRGMDARLTVAVNRLVFKALKRHTSSTEETPRQIPARTGEFTIVNPRAQNTIAAVGLTRWATRKAIAVLRGGIGLRLTAPMWGAVWREQEYAADSWAASIGQGEALAEFLESHTLTYDHPIPLVGLTDHTHPPTELRIDRLRKSAQEQAQQPASATGPVWLG